MRALVIGILATACGGSSPSTPPTDASEGSESVPIDATPARLVAYISGGADIAWYEVDNATGALTKTGSIAGFQTGASFLAVHGSNLYAVTSGNRVGAYAIDPASGALTFLNDVASAGTGPTHVSVDATGTTAFVANYGNGNIGVFPIQATGRLATATQTITAGANAHQIVADPSNKFVLVPCLGVNRVMQYTFAAGTLTANATPFLATAAGAGPRHLAFAPDGTHAYLINELDSTLQALAFDTTTGRLTSLQTITTRAAGATGTNTTAEVFVHPSGKFVYGSNRGDDNIAIFSIDPTTGMLALVGHRSTGGMTPRNFGLDPAGRFLYAANQASNTVVPFAIDPTTGLLTPTAAPISVPTPQYVGIYALP